MKKILLLIIFTSLFISCAPMLSVPQYIEKNSTPLNVATDKEIGETLLEYQEGHFANAIIITSEAKAKEPKVRRVINEGEVFINTERSGKFDYYYPEGTKNISSYGIIINTENNTARLWIANAGYSFYELEKPLQYTTTTRPHPNYTCMKKEFLYNGKSGNTVHFTYREFANDWARPAFTQDLQYDLSESNVIGFKGMRIEVDQATNTNILYKVMSGFTK